MAGVCTSVLKQRSVTRVRVNNELRIRQMRAERERIDRRNHDVVFPVRDKHRLRFVAPLSRDHDSSYTRHRRKRLEHRAEEADDSPLIKALSDCEDNHAKGLDS